MSHLPRFASLALLSAPLAVLVACNEVETGAYGLVEFIPDDCGAATCDLDDPLAVDGETDVYLDGVDGRPVDHLTIRTSDPFIAEVIDEEPGTWPRVTIVGNRPGIVDLLAVDEYGDVVDYVTITVAAPDELDVDVTGATVDGPHGADGVDDLYFVDAGAELAIDVTAYAGGWPLLGRMSYSVVIDQDVALAVDPDEDLTDGRFRFAAPAGEHTIVIATPTASRTIHLSVD